MTDADIRAELLEQQELLALEKAADLEYHRRKIEQLPLPKRITEGYAWYPVVVTKSGYTYGNRAWIEIERALPHPPHRFRSGNTVSFFSEAPGLQRAERNGIIQFAERGRMKIILNQEDLPDWINHGQLGVQLLFDERTYREMEKALHKVMNASNDRLAELRDTILGKYAATFREMPTWVQSERLNDWQNAAMREVTGAHQLTVIHGPPGTGKTTTLVEVVLQLTQTERTVLVTAPSNTAADLLTERLAKAGLRVLRIGNISRVDEEVMEHTLEVQIAKHPDSKEVKRLRIEAAELRRKAKRFKRNFGAEQRRERGQMFKEAGQISGYASHLEQHMLEKLIEGAQVICCTLVGANHPTLEKKTFRTVVIDEAAQALEPATWIPILKASKVVFAGDPFQLPPTVKSNEAARRGFNVTLLEKALQRQERTSLLRTQYRMHEAIMGFSNQKFYDGALEADASVAKHQLLADSDAPVVFIDTAGAGCEEKLQAASFSRYNEQEFQILCEHLYNLVDHLLLHQVAPLPDIAIISPYGEQVARMKEWVKADSKLVDLPITIKTIDGFQGQERDIVYISLVRSNPKGEIGFLKDYRRMNVAMTRARKKLVIVGDSATISNDNFYKDFLDYVDKHGTYRTAWEYLA